MPHRRQVETPIEPRPAPLRTRATRLTPEVPAEERGITSEVGRERAIAAVAAEAAACTRCPLYKDTTQTVFGEGAPSPRLMLVGEQPGDQEDLQGHPFVGPAGRMLDKALDEAGIDRRDVYITNAVKHFKHERGGKRRLHKRPDRYEIEVCRWWLDRELAILRPAVVVGLGATAAFALMGRRVVLAQLAGEVLGFRGGFSGIVTAHPSAILRVPDPGQRDAAFARLATALARAKAIADPPH